MKSKLILAGTILSCMVLLSSCSVHKSSISGRKKDALLSREPETCCFVQWQDGTFSKFEKIELITGMFKKPMLLADGEIKILPSQIKAYQNEHHYAISQEEFVKPHKTYVASETLPGFAIRIVKGKFNLYAKKVHNGQHTADEYYLQEGDKGKIFACNNEVMNELLQKDPEVFDMVYVKMSKNQKGKKMQNLNMLAKNGRGLSQTQVKKK